MISITSSLRFSSQSVIPGIKSDRTASKPHEAMHVGNVLITAGLFYFGAFCVLLFTAMFICDISGNA